MLLEGKRVVQDLRAGMSYGDADKDLAATGRDLGEGSEIINCVVHNLM